MGLFRHRFSRRPQRRKHPGRRLQRQHALRVEKWQRQQEGNPKSLQSKRSQSGPATMGAVGPLRIQQRVGKHSNLRSSVGICLMTPPRAMAGRFSRNKKGREERGLCGTMGGAAVSQRPAISVWLRVEWSWASCWASSSAWPWAWGRRRPERGRQIAHCRHLSPLW